MTRKSADNPNLSEVWDSLRRLEIPLRLLTEKILEDPINAVSLFQKSAKKWLLVIHLLQICKITHDKQKTALIKNWEDKKLETTGRKLHGFFNSWYKELKRKE